MMIFLDKNDENCEKYEKIFKKFNVKYQIIKYYDLMKFDRNYDEIVLPIGSINFVKYVQNHFYNNIGFYVNFESHNFLNMVKSFEKQCFNYDFVCELFRDFKTFKVIDKIETMVNSYKTFFIRPNSSDKPFSGQLTSINDIYKNPNTKQLEFHNYWQYQFQNINPLELIIISKHKIISEEYRIFVDLGRREIITSSRYKKSISKDCPKESYEYVNFLMNNFDLNYPNEPIVSFDICKNYYNEFFLLETSAFQCAGLYDCNIEKLFERILEYIK